MFKTLNKIFSIPKALSALSVALTVLLILGWGLSSVKGRDITLEPQPTIIGWVFIVYSLWLLGCIISEAVRSIKAKRAVANAK